MLDLITRWWSNFLNYDCESSNSLNVYLSPVQRLSLLPAELTLHLPSRMDDDAVLEELLVAAEQE